jgi:hypothetical protein
MSRLKRDVVSNVVFSLLVTLSFMWTIRQAGNYLAPVTLGAFLLTRRVADTLANLVQAGTPFTLRRYMPMAASGTERRRLIGVALFLVGTVSALLFALVWIAPQWWTRVLLDQQHEMGYSLTYATILLTVALAMANLASSALLASRRIAAVNML